MDRVDCIDSLDRSTWEEEDDDDVPCPPTAEISAASCKDTLADLVVELGATRQQLDASRGTCVALSFRLSVVNEGLLAARSESNTVRAQLDLAHEMNDADDERIASLVSTIREKDAYIRELRSVVVYLKDLLEQPHSSVFGARHSDVLNMLQKIRGSISNPP